MLVVARRLPSAVPEDTVLQVRCILARLVSTLLMSLPLPNFLADLRELDLLPGKIRITVLSLSLRKSRVCVIVELSNLDLHVIIVCLALLLPKYRQYFAAQPLRIDEWQQEIILVDGAGHVEPFRADRSELLVLVV